MCIRDRLNTVARADGFDTEGYCQMSLADTWRPKQNDVLFGFDELQLGQIQQGLSADGVLKAKVKVIQGSVKR